jgi:hypothetical protein
MYNALVIFKQLVVLAGKIAKHINTTSVGIENPGGH